MYIWRKRILLIVQKFMNIHMVNIIELYTNIWTKGLQADISLINNEVYFILGNRIAIRVNNQFQTILNVDNLIFISESGEEIQKIFFY